MDKMPSTMLALGLEPPRGSLLRRFWDAPQPLNPLGGLHGGGAAAPVHRARPARQLVEDVEVAEAPEASRPLSPDPSTSRKRGENGDKGEKGEKRAQP